VGAGVVAVFVETGGVAGARGATGETEGAPIPSDKPAREAATTTNLFCRLLRRVVALAARAGDATMFAASVATVDGRWAGRSAARAERFGG
jgi:hypothetical protein